LRTPRAVRERCRKILDQGPRHFDVVSEAISRVVDRVRPEIDSSRVHGRCRHFEAGGVLRMKELDALFEKSDSVERTKTKIDLVTVSVLLDAGAGDRWSYDENGRKYSRSEGIAVASFRAFLGGIFSREGRPRADEGLESIDERTFRRAFQANNDDLVGVAGRVALLRALGRALRTRGDVFAHGRVGDLLDVLPSPLSATRLLGVLLDALESIWPGRLTLAGHNLGDTWLYRGSLVPFHKLSQWLARSLMEPLEESGRTIDGASELTGLAEYRNGGLLIDAGVLVPRDRDALSRVHAVSDEFVVEWRALTVSLLDEIRARLGNPAGLEAATWAAGRKIAAEMRPGGAPPITVGSDGTVF